MSRDAAGQAKKTFGETQDVYKGASTQKQNLMDELHPIYSSEATHPEGYDHSDLTAMNTAAQEASGGAVAGSLGEGNLRAARTRNSGGFDVAQGESVRDAIRSNSDSALRVQKSNADLKQINQQAGIEGLAGLEGQENRDVLSSLGLSNQSTDALTTAGKSGWFQNFTALVNALNPTGKVAGVGIGG